MNYGQIRNKADETESSLLLSNQLCFPLYSASRKIIRMYTPFLNELELTYTQYITMLVLWENDGLSVKDLGNKLYLDSGTLTPLLKKLEKQGVITRKRNSEDERNVIVFLSEKGKSLKQKALDVPQRISSCIDLNMKDVMELKRLLTVILDG